MPTASKSSQFGSQVADRIGNTPLVRLDQVTRSLSNVALLAKAEWANPGGSVKDRAAASIVRDARARDLLTPGKTLLDATSGNTGIAFAMLGAALGFPVHLAMPSSVSPERKRILHAYGAVIDWTDGEQGIGPAYLFTDPDGHRMAIYYDSEHFIPTGAQRPTLKNQPQRISVHGAAVRRRVLDRVVFAAEAANAAHV